MQVVLLKLVQQLSQVYQTMRISDFAKLAVPDAVVADVKGIWRMIDLPDDYRRWQL